MGLARFLVTVATFLIFLASQLFWFRRLAELGERLIPHKAWRKNLGGVAAIAYIILFAYNLAWARQRHSHRPDARSGARRSAFPVVGGKLAPRLCGHHGVLGR